MNSKPSIHEQAARLGLDPIRLPAEQVRVIVRDLTDTDHDHVEQFEHLLRTRLGTTSGMTADEHDLILDLLERLTDDRVHMLRSILTKVSLAMVAGVD